MIVRHLILCEAVRQRPDGKDDLEGVANFVVVPQGTKLPAELSGSFTFHLCVTEVRKAARIRLEWAVVVDQDFTLPSQEVTIPMPPTPADEVFLPVRVNRLPSRSVGQYEMRVLRGRRVIASLPVMVEYG